MVTRPVKLFETDTVFPVCHAGQNRSQVMHAVVQVSTKHPIAFPPLRNTLPELVWLSLVQDISDYLAFETGRRSMNVERPHGALSGFDP